MFVEGERHTEKLYLAVLRCRLRDSKLVDMAIGEVSKASHKMVPVYGAYCLPQTVPSLCRLSMEQICGVEVTKAR
ncbi:hypothetical protein BIW11_04412 [Tropilaelaps mercedesae]|uniref:Uncharacterized protein n=1 Tax=Tropilaelaps mercedesae TaxID=418985 RepID=A0A1V9X6T0_9ACAR|nr:hypothetical protein BIW11_04412 [Tropilaelaps mercedesae]